MQYVCNVQHGQRATEANEQVFLELHVLFYQFSTSTLS